MRRTTQDKIERGAAPSQHAPGEPRVEDPEEVSQSDEPEQDFHLGKATEEELKRLGTHPIQETERLREEMREGETASGLLLLVSTIAASVWFIAALLMVAVFLTAYFVAR